MKETHLGVRSISLLGILLGIAVVIALAGCGTQRQQATATPTVDNGPNAGLSNEELLSQALTNTAALKSYAFDFVGIEPAGALSPTSRLTMTGYEQPAGQGVRVSARGEHNLAGHTYSLIATLADQTSQMPHELIMLGQSMYMSGDGGKSWQVFAPGGGSMFVPPEVVLCSWAGNGSDTGQWLTPCANMIRIWKFKDAEQRTETIGGVPTRHLVADLFAPENKSPQYAQMPMIINGEPQAASSHLWISTGATPLVRQLQFDVTYKETAGGSSMRPFNDVAFSPKGDLLAGVHMGATSSDSSSNPNSLEREPESTVLVWNLANPDSAPTKLVSDSDALIQSLVFSPDGKVLAASVMGANPRSGVYLWDTGHLEAKPALLALPGDSSPIIAFSPDGKKLATLQSDGVRFWDAPFAGQENAQLAIPGTFRSLAFSPDGKTLAAAAESGLFLYKIEDLKAAPLMLNGEPAQSPAFSPDGQMLAAVVGGNSEGTAPTEARLWDLRHPEQPLTSFPGSGRLMFSFDGKSIASGATIWDVQQLVAGGSSVSPVRESKSNCQERQTTFSLDLQKWAVACQESKVELWDLSSAPSAGEPTILWRDPSDANQISNQFTWTWSRFNEDLGEVKAPPTETIK